MERKSKRRSGAFAASGALTSSPWSWCFCDHAPRGFDLASLLFSWILFSLVICMPCFARGQYVSVLNKTSNCLELHACDSVAKTLFNPSEFSVGDNDEGLEELMMISPICRKGKHACFGSQSVCVSCAKSKKKDGTTQSASGIHKLTHSYNGQEIQGSANSKDLMKTENNEQSSFILSDGRNIASSSFPDKCLSNQKISNGVMKLELPQAEVFGSVLPNVAVRPVMMEWEPHPLFSPSLLSLTVINNCNETSLHIFMPYSTNSQFYSYDFEEAILPPGKMISIPFVFLPEVVGLATGHIVLQTSMGGFLIQAKGLGLESPFKVTAFTGISALSGVRLQKNVSLYNPFEGLLFVEEVSMCITESENVSKKAFGIVWKDELTLVDSDDMSLSKDSLLSFGREAAGGLLLSLKPLGEWLLSSYSESTFLQFEMSAEMEGKFSGALCIAFGNASKDSKQKLIIPLEVNILKNPGKILQIYPSFCQLESSSVSDTEQIMKGALALENDGSEIIKLEQIIVDRKSEKYLDIQFLKGLILFPATVTHVAMVTYKNVKKPCEDCQLQLPSILPDCQLIIVTNSTSDPQLNIRCQDLVHYNFKQKNDIFLSDSGNSLDRFFQLNDAETLYDKLNGNNIIQPISESSLKDNRLEFATKGDELFLRNWKLQGTSDNCSLLAQRVILYSVVQNGANLSKLIHVINPTEHIVAMQLILGSEPLSLDCKHYEKAQKKWDPDNPHVPTDKRTRRVAFNSSSQLKQVFLLPENGTTEASVQPHSKAVLGPIVFQPSESCIWKTFAFLRNNLSGVESLHLQGAGSNFKLTLYEGLKEAEELQFIIHQASLFSAIWTMKFYSSKIFCRAGSKNFCNTSLQKTLIAKNTGDAPLQINVVNIGGKACASNGFRVHTCDGFFLIPGESIELLVSFQSDFSASAVYQELEFPLPSGILIVPLHARIPNHMVALCTKSLSELILRKVLILVFVAVVVYAVTVWRTHSNEPAHICIKHFRQGKKFAISPVPKDGRQMHGEHTKQRSPAVARVQHLHVPPAKAKGSKEEHAELLKSKIERNFGEGNRNDLSRGREKVRVDVLSGYKPFKYLQECDNRDDVKTGGDDETPEKQKYDLVAQKVSADDGSASVEFSRNHYLDKQAKQLHDSKDNKDLSSSYGGDNNSRNHKSISKPLSDSSFFSVGNDDALKATGVSDVSFDAPISGRLTIKLPKEKSRRRKRKNSSNIAMKQDLPGSHSGHSTPSSPPSPITPASSSSPHSPRVRTALQSTLLLNDVDLKNHGSSACTNDELSAKSQKSAANLCIKCGVDEEVCKFCKFDIQPPKLHAPVTTNTEGRAKPKTSRESASAVSGDWLAVAKKTAESSAGNLMKPGSCSSTKKSLSSSATFPRGRYCKSNLQTPSPSLVSTSSIAPDARAPGTKLNKSNPIPSIKNVNADPVEQDSTYDIWGNNFAGFPLTSTNTSVSNFGLPNASVTPIPQDYSHSFFAMFVPQSNVENASEANKSPVSTNSPESLNDHSDVTG